MNIIYNWDYNKTFIRKKNVNTEKFKIFVLQLEHSLRRR